MLSKKEREYLRNPDEFAMRHGLEYSRVLRGRIKKKAAQAIKDLTLIAADDQDFINLEQRVKKWAIYRTLRDGDSGIYTREELIEHFLNPPPTRGNTRRLIRTTELEGLILECVLTYPIRGNVLGELIERGKLRLR